MPLKKFWGILLLVLPGLCFAGKSEIQAIRVWPSPDNTRVVFDLSVPAQYNVQRLKNPERVVIDFTNTRLKTDTKKLALQNTLVKKIRAAHRKGNQLRVVIELNKNIKPNTFMLKPNERYGHRLVMDLDSIDRERILALFDLDQQPVVKKSSPKSQDTSKIRQVRDFLIAIDAGHGGEDPGAIGPRGTYEKTVVLAIAKQLQTMINKEANMQAILIRKGDYYVGLRERMLLARHHGVDLFISIHADAYRNPRAKGSSVFILSDHGASSEAAKWLAASENRSDLVGGIRLKDKSNVLASVLLDLSQTASKAESVKAARYVLRSIGRVMPLHKTRVEHAGFAVLKSPDVPSMLVETGFISNPKTELKLRTKQHQRKIARSILTGLRNYFKGKPKPLKNPSILVNKSRVYRVKPGDNLSKIAKHHRVSVLELKRINLLVNDKIKIGQKLTIPDDKRK